MDALAQYLALRDGVSAPLNRMTRAADALYESQEAAAQAVSNLETRMDDLGQSLSSGEGFFQSVSGGMKSMIGQFALGSLAADAFMSAAAFVSELPGRIVDASDAYAGMQARLNLVTGSAEHAAEMNEQIYQSAIRARGSYAGMADAVSKIAMTAKDAFPDPQQVVPFVEGIQKLFAIGGTGIQQQADAMLQLQQALGSGKLQGDEFRSIAEAAPLVEKMVAQELGVSQGALKELSSQGLITADIMRNAILHNLDQINADFEKMPLTWGQAWQNMGTIATHAMAPVYDALSNLVNSNAMNAFLNGFSTVMPLVGSVLSVAVNGVSVAVQTAASAISYLTSWAYAGALLMASGFEAAAPVIIGGLSGIAAYLFIVNGHLAVEAALQASSAAWTAVSTGAKAAWAAVTNMQTVAATALNAVLNANPIMWVARLALVAVSAFVAWQVGTVGLRNTIAQAFSDIAETAESVINFVIDKINWLIRGINTVAQGLSSITGANISTIGTIEWKAEGWGGKAYDAVQNFDMSKMMAGISVPAVPDVGNYQYGGTQGSDVDIGTGEGPAAKETAGNTRGILEAMGIMDEDIKFFRDAAEQEVINRYTTARVEINVENTNNIASDVDADGMITHLIDQLSEAELAGAEAVHI